MGTSHQRQEPGVLRIDGRVCCRPADLAEAARCEYAVLRRLDLVLGRVAAVATGDDALRRRIATVGARHEASTLEAMRAAGRVVSLPGAETPPTAAGLRAAQAVTLRAVAGSPDVVHRAAFFDGEMLGCADFLRRAPGGWEVCDATLARQARTEALLGLAAHADLAARAGVPVAPEVALLLGGGGTERFPLAEVLPVYAARRHRLRHLVAEHQAEAGAVTWGDERYVACGWCAECQAAVLERRDLLLVARMRLDQRRRLHDLGIHTIDDLARATARPEYMTDATFERLRAQAALQRRYLGTGEVGYELTADAPSTLAALPPPSAGDLFFDFEGDPLHREGDRWGLEYLWGVLDGRGYQATWAHDAAEEHSALTWFLDLLEERRAEHPDLHVYHYAAYETAALKRLVAWHQVGESRLDGLLRAGVFVDLYAVVRGAVRAATSSYGLKRLEPLFLVPGDRRAGEVQSGEASVVEYHDYRALRDDGDTEAAERRLTALAAYNADDCVATVRLRDWLLRLAGEAGVRAGAEPSRPAAPQPPDEDALLRSLAARAGTPGHRTADEQAYALLAAALGYFRREARPYWWAHFDRLAARVDDWSETRDVFRVEAAQVLSDWAVPDGSVLEESGPPARRVLRLTGRWGPGSTPGSDALVVYEPPLPPGARTAEGGLLGWRPARAVECSDDDDRAVVLTETCAAEDAAEDSAAALPAALTPAPPPHAGQIERAIREVASRTVGPGGLPAQPAIDLLRRRTPRTSAALPCSGDPVADVTAALLTVEDSFLAVQGPPGSGKTWTGSRVVAGLVARHGWRVGVVAQSHAAVEAMLDAVVAAGLDPARVGKAEARHSARPRWRVLGGASRRAGFLAGQAGVGCVLGGTAWTFSADRLVQPGGLDLLVVDEAGQLALAPTIGVSRSARRLLLLGDPQQLPQVSQGSHGEPVDRSALGWLLAGQDTLPAELGYFLGLTHRMHPALCDKVSILAYDGRLKAAPAASRLLEGVQPGLRVVRVEHRDNRTSSPEEADEVVAQVSGLLGRPWHDAAGLASPRPLGQADLRVVAPYNAQVHLVRRRLREAGLADVPVGTVDRFQGQEAPVVLVTMTASSHGDVPRGMRFLLNRNRVNVAVSRAQWLAVLVCSDRLTGYLPSSTEGMLELGAFLRLTGGADGAGAASVVKPGRSPPAGAGPARLRTKP